jgi:hypothetical protein
VWCSFCAADAAWANQHIITCSFPGKRFSNTVAGTYYLPVNTCHENPASLDTRASDRYGLDIGWIV